MILQPAYCTDGREHCNRERLQEPYLVEDGLESLGIVGLAVTLGTLRADADEVGRGVVDVLRVAASDNLAVAVKQDRCLLDGRDGTLGEGRVAVGAVVDIALRPGVDGQSAAGEDGGAVQNADGDWDVGQLDVVEDGRARELAVA